MQNIVIYDFSPRSRFSYFKEWVWPRKRGTQEEHWWVWSLQNTKTHKTC